MKHLIEIANVISIKRVKEIALFDRVALNKRGSKLSAFYKGIRDGQYKTDEAAAMALYNASPKNGTYKWLKSELRKRLVNNLFFLDINDPSYSDYEQAYYTCYKNMVVCKILITHGARTAGIRLARQTLGKAKKYHFTDVVMSCVRLLMDHAALVGDAKSYQQYWKLIKDVQKLLELEVLAEHYYQDLIINYSKSVSAKKRLSVLAANYTKELKRLAKKSDSFTLHYYLHIIEALKFQIAGDYKRALHVYEEFERYLLKKPMLKHGKLQAKIAMYKLDCYLYLNDFKHGEQVAAYVLKSYPKGSTNWFIFNETFFLLAIRTANYVQAKKIFNTVVYHAKYDYLTSDRQEKWRIFEAYLNFIQESGYIPQRIKGQRQKRFRIAKFLNEVPIFSKDKRGYNIAILIIHVLFLLRQEDYNGIIDRVDALKVYHNRYLKGEDDVRSKLFIKMLLIMEKESFEYAGTEKKAAKYYEQLRQTQFRHEGTPMDAEIIPYEALWGMVLDVLR